MHTGLGTPGAPTRQLNSKQSVVAQRRSSIPTNVLRTSSRDPGPTSPETVELSTLLSKQSRTTKEARTEYARRYGRQPPPHFDAWFELAMQHDFKLIDEFDGAMRSLEPFWGVAPSTLRTLTHNALVQLPSRLIKYEVINHQVSATQGSELPWLRQAIAEWLPSEWTNLVPNMTLAINVLDEPSVCIPHDVLSQALDRAHSRHDSGISTSQVSKHISRASPRFLDIGKQDVWEAVTVVVSRAFFCEEACLRRQSGGKVTSTSSTI